MKSGAFLILTLWIALLGVQAACAGGVLDHCTTVHRDHAGSGDADAGACGDDPCAQDFDAPLKTTRASAVTPPACFLEAAADAPTGPAPAALPPSPVTSLGEPARPAGRFPLLI